MIHMTPVNKKHDFYQFLVWAGSCFPQNKGQPLGCTGPGWGHCLHAVFKVGVSLRRDIHQLPSVTNPTTVMELRGIRMAAITGSRSP